MAAVEVLVAAGSGCRGLSRGRARIRAFFVSLVAPTSRHRSSKIAPCLYGFCWRCCCSSPSSRRRPSNPSRKPSTHVTPRRLRCSRRSSTSTAARGTSTACARSARSFAPSSTRSGSGRVGRRRTVAARRASRRRTIGQRARRPRVLLIGHLDTVFERDSPFQTFERIDAPTARGPGIIDMKGGDVVMRAGAQGARRPPACSTTLNVDCRDDGRRGSARRPLAARARGARRARPRGGRRDWLRGRPRRSALRRHVATRHHVVDAAGHGDVRRTRRRCSGPTSGRARSSRRPASSTAFAEKLAGEEHLTFNPGLIVGGTSTRSTIAAEAARIRVRQGQRRRGRMRVVIGRSPRRCRRSSSTSAKQAMQDVASASLPHTRGTLTFDDGYPPMAPTDGNARLLDALRAASARR